MSSARWRPSSVRGAGWRRCRTSRRRSRARRRRSRSARRRRARRSGARRHRRRRLRARARRATLRVIGTWGYDAGDRRARSARSPLLRATCRRRRRRASGARSRSTPREALARRYPALTAASATGSLCAVPLLAGDEVLGAVGVSRAERRAFDAAELELLEALGAPGRAGARARAALRRQRCQRPPAPAADDRGAGAGADAAGGRRDGGGAGRGGARREQRVGGAAGRGRALARARARRRPRAERPGSASRRSRSTPSCRWPRPRAPPTPVWLESAEAIFGGYPRFREVRPQAQSAALLPLADDGRRARRDRARVRLPARRSRRTTATTCWR